MNNKILLYQQTVGNIFFLLHICIQLFQLTLSDQSLKFKDMFKEAATSSIWYPNISFIQMARHRISSLDGRGIADFDELIHIKIYKILRSGLIAFADSEQRPSLKQKIWRCLLVTFFFFFFFFFCYWHETVFLHPATQRSPNKLQAPEIERLLPTIATSLETKNCVAS